uniref:Uncharacterized protein n=1 Tax=Arundo donax TaxID=35708 RepID=A0A0A8Z655_ARUDO
MAPIPVSLVPCPLPILRWPRERTSKTQPTMVHRKHSMAGLENRELADHLLHNGCQI